jgi:hypothetical protein
VFIVLLAVAGWLITAEGDSNSTISLEGQDRYAFTISDTASVDKIIIKDKSPSEVVLSRSKGGWLVNGEFKARKGAMLTLLGTLSRMEMRNFIEEKMQQTVIRRMSVYGREVQIFKNGELYRVFYVGTESQDEMATYMMIKGSDQPFAVHIPGFNGFLSSRFFTQPYLWKSRDIISINKSAIKEIEMLYPDSAEASFKVNRFSGDSVYVTNLSTGEVLKNRNRVNTNLFLSAFRNLKYEGAIIPSDPIYERRDSLLSNQPLFRLTITDINGKKTSLSGYRIKGPLEQYDPDVPLKEYDPDRMHGFINNEQMVLIQYVGLKNVLKTYSYFSAS